MCIRDRDSVGNVSVFCRTSVMQFLRNSCSHLNFILRHTVNICLTLKKHCVYQKSKDNKQSMIIERWGSGMEGYPWDSPEKIKWLKDKHRTLGNCPPTGIKRKKRPVNKICLLYTSPS